MQDLAARKTEVAVKIAQVRSLLTDRHLQAVIIGQTPNVAWLSAGATTYVNIASETGVVAFIITSDAQYALTDSIEIHRMEQEERLGELGFAMIVEPWYSKGKTLAEYQAKADIGSDLAGYGQHLRAEFVWLRSNFTVWEEERLREGGKLAAAAMSEAIRAVRPGMTEFAVAGLLSDASNRHGGAPIVNLVASDERIYRYRHPLPTMKAIDRYAMLVLCFRYQGLVLSITRLAHFGPLPAELRRRMMAVATVDATIIAGTQPTRTMDEMFHLLKASYAAVGFPEAIEEHHQGGSMGYASREQLAIPGNLSIIQSHQGFAWNPSVAGVKSEDTVLLTGQGIEIVTEIADWPAITTVAVGQTNVARPLIMVVE